MDGVIFLIILVPLTIVILLIIIASKSSANQESLQSVTHKLNRVQSQLSDIKAQLKDLKLERGTTLIPEIKKKVEVEKPVRPEVPTIPKQEQPEVTKPAPQKEQANEIRQEQVTSIDQPAQKPLPAADKEMKEASTDWEKFIGENLANKIGIAVLVLGISFFVKFAIDKNWINETGRVIVGLISGGILITLAHYIRNTYRSFSSVLVGGGLTVFYFTIAFAFHQYHLLSQQAAFIIMVFITAFAVSMSLYYDRLELAVLAAIGGFVTPFLVSTGQNNFVALFTYLCILNSGLLVLSWFKKWKAINIISLVSTSIIYGGWFIKQLFISEPFPYRWALLFASLFYVLFTSMAIVNNLRRNIKFGAFDFIVLLVINFLYYAAGVIILEYWGDGDYKGLFTAILGIANLVLAVIFFKEKRVDRNFVQLLIGLTVAFISLTGPVQLKGNHITLFWVAEMVLLFWLYQRTRILQLKIAALLIIAPLLISLFMDWGAVYSDLSELLPMLINRGFVTSVVSAIGFIIFYQLMRSEANQLYLPGIENRQVRNFLLTSGVILAYSAGALEIYFQFNSRFPSSSVYIEYFQVYSFAFVIGLLAFFKKTHSSLLLRFVLTMAAMALYIYNMRVNYAFSMQMLSGSEDSRHFWAHWLSAVLLGWVLYALIRLFREDENIKKDYEISFSWILTFCVVFLLSAEMRHAFAWITYSDAENREYWENLYYKAGLSILWGLCSFVMMWLGMKHRFKTLRIISLTLFTITLVKLFLYDISNIPPGGKIAAFIFLGILLLIVSFMYQRLKKIIIDDSK
jgi:uncharacterized membrane protein